MATGSQRQGWGMPFAGFVLPALILRPGLETALGLVHMNLGPISVTLGFLFNIDRKSVV